MNSRKWTVFWASLGGVVLIYFQNCAPAPTVNDFEDSEVRIVDQWQSKPGFNSISYEIRDPNTAVRLDGRCQGFEGSDVNWELVRKNNQSEQIFNQGRSACVSGVFKVLLSSVPLADCSDTLYLRVNFNNSESAEVLLQAMCQ